MLSEQEKNPDDKSKAFNPSKYWKDPLWKEFEEQISAGVPAGKMSFFEGCLPVEVLAGRSLQALAFGPMRPVGLKDPRTGKRPWAVLQLRQDDLSGSLYISGVFIHNLILIFPKYHLIHTKDGIDRSPDLVRHTCQEFCLGFCFANVFT